MLNIQALISANRKMAKNMQSILTVTFRSSENIPTVRKDLSRQFVTNIHRCSSNSSWSTSHRDIFSTYRLIRSIKQISCFKGVQRQGWELRELSTMNNLPIIYLFTKDGCTLCDEAKAALGPHMHRFILKEVDITLPENEHWFEMYKYDIPVFHIYEDFLFKHRVDFDALEKGLEKYRDGFKSSK